MFSISLRRGGSLLIIIKMRCSSGGATWRLEPWDSSTSGGSGHSLRDCNLFLRIPGEGPRKRSNCESFDDVCSHLGQMGLNRLRDLLG